MPVELVKRYLKRDVRQNRHKLYVFGDNYLRHGLGGQAFACRGEPNTVGVRTKKAPTNEPGSFLTDEQYEVNCRRILEDLRPALEALLLGRVVVLPEDGIGTGLANLKENAPRTLKFVERCFRAMEVMGIIAEHDEPGHVFYSPFIKQIQVMWREP